MLKHVYEHLKTKKKYNTLELKYDMKQAELERTIVELNTQKRINKIEREKFEKVVDDYIQKLAKEKEKNKSRRVKK